MADNALSFGKQLDIARISREDYLNSLTAEAYRTGIFSDADVERIRNDLLVCLTDVIGYYTKGESSSVKAETARKLSLSMLYNIDTYLRSLGSDTEALKTVSERRMTELYGKGYLINKKLLDDAKFLYGKVRFTRLKDGGAEYDKTLDRYFYYYLTTYDARFTAQDKIFLSLRKYGVDGAFHIDGALESLRKLYEVNKGRQSDVVISPTESASDDGEA